MANRWETVETVADFIFLGSKITADGDCSHEIKRRLLLGRKVMTNLDSTLKSRHYFVNKGPSSQGYGFSSGHVWMWELDYKESWALKNWWFWAVVLKKSLESPLDCKKIQPVHPKGNQSWVFIGRTDVEAETPIFWPPDVKSWLIWKDPDVGKDRRQEEKGMRGWDGWMASPTQWTWVWVNSRSWWWTGRPGMQRFMGSQRVGHNWATELNWTKYLSKVMAPVANLAVGEVYQVLGASLVAQMVKNLPAMQETWIWSLGWEDPLEKGMATHSSILAWRIPWTEEAGRLQSMGPQSQTQMSN